MVPPGDGGGFASFSVTGFFDDLVQLQQTFLLPSHATALTFEIHLSTVAGGTSWPFAANDSFQVSLLDPLGDPQFAAVPGLFSPFYVLDSGGLQTTGSGVGVVDLSDGRKQITLNLTSLPSQSYTIDFLLLGDDDELTTTVALDNVAIAQASNVVPEPTSLALWTLLGLTAGPFAVRRRRRSGTRPASPSRVKGASAYRLR